MSFGISIGDFVSVAVVIKGIVSSLQAASTSEYKELILELHSLQRALDEIEHLDISMGNEAAVNAVKVAALMCQHPLSEFAVNLRRFENLAEEGCTSHRGRLKLYSSKLRWGFTMKEEIQKLRAYLIAHVGSLNMRLNVLGLKASSTMMLNIEARNDVLLQAAAASQIGIHGLAQEAQSHRRLIAQSHSWSESIINLVNVNILPQLTVLVELVGRIWTANLRIIDILIKLQHTGPALDTQYTWFQQPVKFEDALGRVLPIPSEYNWSKIHAIIIDQFKTGPDHEKVLCGEFELLNTRDTTQILSTSEVQALLPGMSITMAFIIGTYAREIQNQCPRPGCRSDAIKDQLRGGKTCSSCHVWFDFARRPFPRPFCIDAGEDDFKKIRADSKWFKNVRIFPRGISNIEFPTGRQIIEFMSPADIPSKVLTAGFFRGDLDNFKSSLLMEIESALHLEPDTIDIEVPLIDYGLDSLSAIQIEFWILDNAGVDISLYTLLRKTSVTEIYNEVMACKKNE